MKRKRRVGTSQVCPFPAHNVRLRKTMTPAWTTRLNTWSQQMPLSSTCLLVPHHYSAPQLGAWRRRYPLPIHKRSKSANRLKQLVRARVIHDADLYLRGWERSQRHPERQERSERNGKRSVGASKGWGKSLPTYLPFGTPSPRGKVKVGAHPMIQSIQCI